MEPIIEDNDLVKKVREGVEGNIRESQNRAYGSIILAKLADLFTVFLSLIIIGIVIYIFSEGIFEGFISAVAGYISISHFFRKRNKSWYSWFFGWFEYNN